MFGMIIILKIIIYTVNKFIMNDIDFKTMQQVAACGFEPIQRRGKGTYGIVYEVGDLESNVFAFKYILPDIYYNEDGLRDLIEYDILTRINHPYVIHAHKILTKYECQIDGLAIVLPLADRTLSDIITDIRATTDDKLPIFYKLASALDFMHDNRILHLDIKATNIVLQGLQDNHPLFIDFGLSSFVEDTKIGKYIDQLKVTMDYRPPEILAGGRIYNTAVDIWSFGIMMLYVLSSNINMFRVDWANVTESQFYNHIRQLFSNPQYITMLLNGVREKYKPGCIDLISKMLQIDPDKRITAKEILDHPIFDGFRIVVIGNTIIPQINYNYAPDHRNIIKLIFHVSNQLYPNVIAEMLFLAIDLFNRIGSYYKNRVTLDRMSVAAACLWTSSKILELPLVLLPDYIESWNLLIPELRADSILNNEIEIIHTLGGILNVNNLYHNCINNDEVRLSFQYVIMASDSSLYAKVDIPAWSNTMKGITHQQIASPKTLTISLLS
jgi:serine/threonine protein kinase